MKNKEQKIKDLCVRTISLDSLKEHSFTNFNLDYSENDTVASVCISAKEFADYMERNNYTLLEIWVHTFQDDYTAICVKTPEDFVEINQIPYINQQLQNNVTPTGNSKASNSASVMNPPERIQV